jgi:hypothetical protein
VWANLDEVSIIEPIVQQKMAMSIGTPITSLVDSACLPNPMPRRNAPLSMAPVAVFNTASHWGWSVGRYPGDMIARYVVPSVLAVTNCCGKLFERPIVGVVLVSWLSNHAVTEAERNSNWVRQWGGLAEDHFGLVRNLCLPCLDGCAAGSPFCRLVPKLADKGGLEISVSIASSCREPSSYSLPEVIWCCRWQNGRSGRRRRRTCSSRGRCRSDSDSVRDDLSEI